MAEAFVSIVLEQLTSIISQEIQQEVRLVVGVKEQVKKLTNNFNTIQDVLIDAEQRQLKEAQVRRWVDQLKDASYDMEDVLDEWKTEMMKLQIEGVPKKKVCFRFPTFCFRFKQVGLRRDIALKIKQINENLDDIVKSKDMFNFNVIKSFKEPQRVESVSFVEISEIRGRAEEKNTLISKLLCESSEQQQGLHIISIVGMGGIGKTTLAQLAYNDKKVINHFEKRLWVCVSDPFDEFRIAKAIIEALEGSATNLGETLQSLLLRINASSTRKKFLLVLDDVWTEDYNKWEPFHHCLQNGLRESRILVTTRKKSVAEMMESFDIIDIKELSKQECWSLFKRFSFFGWPPSECEKLEEIGKKIVDKCKGLPLAAKTIGSLLRFKKSKEEWQNILNSEMWKIEEIEKGVLTPLLLSYNDLPCKIKLCFSYCAIFLKDHIIVKDELIKLWMAQGYLNGEGNKEMERVGEEYFDYLATRSFFQEFRKDDYDNVEACKMHDIVHDFAQFLRKNECFLLEIGGPEEPLINSTCLDKVRHSTLVLGESTSSPVFIFSAQRLRSLFISGQSNICLHALGNVFDLFTCLRALTITTYYSTHEVNAVDKLPKGLENLSHLRYLKLSGLRIKELPENCCELYNLQTLDIQDCRKLRRLPHGIGKLVSLRHLKYDVDILHSMPKEIGRLTGLQTLRDFVVSDGGPCNLECLKHLNHLQGFLRIRGLGNVTDVDEAKKVELEKKKNLSTLEFCFDKEEEETTERTNEVDHEGIIEALRPNPNIKRLKISRYRGKMVFPNWLMSLSNLKILNLIHFMNCETMPPLGKLPSLETIYIEGMWRVKRVGAEFLGIESNGTTSSSSVVIVFPKLKSLQLWLMDEWEEWDFGISSSGKEDLRIMPNLESLEITCCPKLKTLPDQILQSTTLKLLDIYDCPILAKRFRKKSGEDWNKISHIPNIEIY